MYYEFKIRQFMAQLGEPMTHEQFMSLSVFEAMVLGTLADID